jgi:hypothetical protein
MPFYQWPPQMSKVLPSQYRSEPWTSLYLYCEGGIQGSDLYCEGGISYLSLSPPPPPPPPPPLSQSAVESRYRVYFLVICSQLCVNYCNVCVYYCRTYCNSQRCVCLLLQYLLQNCSRRAGGGGTMEDMCYVYTTRDYEPRPVWTSLPITH